MRIRMVPLSQVIQKLLPTRQICRVQRVVYLVVLFVFWTTLFAWITVLTRTKPDVVNMSKDYRIVPELNYPPVKVTDAQYASISDMLTRLKAEGYLQESRDSIFDGRYPRWPFFVPRGQPLIRDEAKPTNHNRDGMILGERFSYGARQFALYDPDEIDIDHLLTVMAKRPVHTMEEVPKGTQLKFKLTLENYGPTMFKPQRYDRSYETSPNHFYFSDFERHNAEIAAFHIDRILGWYRAPPVVGRMVNITQDLFIFTNGKLKMTFFISPANNWCFTGECKYYCDVTHAFCGNPYMIEGSIATFLPPDSLTKLYKIKSPWRRSYNRHKLADWNFRNGTYCDEVKASRNFKQPRRIIDIIDTHVFDFILGNMDRHHYLFYGGFPANNTFHLHFDHGRGFGRVNHDEMSILTPLIQCCSIRYSTFYKLVTFHEGHYSLSQLLRESLSRDPVSPVLAEGHYGAVDRRVVKILSAVADCLVTKPLGSVIIDDGF